MSIFEFSAKVKAAFYKAADDATPRVYLEKSQPGRPAAARDSRVAAAGGGPADRLESKSNKVTGPGQAELLKGRTLLVSKSCRCRTCDECGRKRGAVTRRRLEAHIPLGAWKRTAIFTLSVDRHGTNTGRGFSGPEAAHRHITGNKFIPRLLRRLGVRQWAWVLEFQTKTGDGWPHWHILVDLDTCPQRQISGKSVGWLDLALAWQLWRDTWKIGGIDLSVSDEGWPPEKAVRYITKYLMKQPEAGYPVWVLTTVKTVRFVAGCRSLGPLVGPLLHEAEPGEPDDDDPAGDEDERPFDSPAEEDADDPSDEASTPRRVRRPFKDRMAECGRLSSVFREMIHPETGAVTLHHLGVVPLSPSDLHALSRVGGFRGQGFEVNMEVTPTQFGTRTDYILDGHPRQLVEKLQNFCKSPYGLAQHVDANLQAIEDRRTRILDENLFAKRLADRQDDPEQENENK